jgi:4-amino-4-deoxy-L-arabinose transferase-like glycosyltransferase
LKYFIFILFVILLFHKNESLCLWEQDEAAYAGFAYTMVETGEYAIPDFEWSWPHRKPPLHFWLIAASYSIFGYNEFATRVPSVLAILVSLCILYYFSRRLYSEKIAMWTAFVFMGSLLIPVYGKISMTDATLLVCFTGSYFSIQSYLQSRNIKWLFYLFVFTSMGGLTKGPPIFITTCGALGLSFIFCKERKMFFSLLIVCILSLIPFLVWAFMTWTQDQGQFINWWIDWYILKRTSGTIYGQTGFIGYYFLVFVVCFFPWILFMPKGLNTMFKDFLLKNKSSQFFFQFSWIIFGWLFYEFIKSKLPSYAFAVIPLWSLYLAQAAVSFKENPSRLILNYAKVLGLFFILIGMGIIVVKDKIPFENFQTTALVLSLFFSSFGLIYLLHSKIKFLQNRLPEFALTFAFGLNFIAWSIALPAFESTRRFPKLIAEKVIALNYKPKHVFFSADYSMSSLPVYLSWAGYTYQTAPREYYEQVTFDSLRYSKNDLFMLQRRNFHYLEEIPDSFKLTPIYGWISDRGKVDTFFIAERRGFKTSLP